MGATFLQRRRFEQQLGAQPGSFLCFIAAGSLEIRPLRQTFWLQGA